jgi:peptide/nickel transport system permease protein
MHDIDRLQKPWPAKKWRRVAWLRIVGRLLIGLGVAWTKVTAILVALLALPSRIQDILAGGLDHPGLREAIAAEWALDRSLLHRYLDFLFRIFRDDFGVSGAPAVDSVGSQLLPTIELAFTAGLLSIPLSIVLALLTAGRGQLSLHIDAGLEMVFASTPVFWLGILLLVAFAFDPNWFAASGAEVGWSLVLPSVAMALPTTGLLTLTLREAMEKAPGPTCATTTRVGGVGDFIPRARQALQQALSPILTLGVWLIGGLLGGSMLTEIAFGPVVLGPILAHDIPAVSTVILLASFVHVGASMLIESVDVIIDPRLGIMNAP